MLPFYQTLEDPERPGRMRAEWTADGNHPSVAGHRRLGELAFRGACRSPFVVRRCGGLGVNRRAGAPTGRSCGSIAQALNDLELAFSCLRDVQLETQVVLAGTIAAGPPGPSAIADRSSAAITSAWSSDPTSLTAAAQSRSPR